MATETGGTGIGLVPLLFQDLLLVTGGGPAQDLLRVIVESMHIHCMMVLSF
jgi:hypothetical protein